MKAEETRRFSEVKKLAQNAKTGQKQRNNFVQTNNYVGRKLRENKVKQVQLLRLAAIFLSEQFSQCEKSSKEKSIVSIRVILILPRISRDVFKALLLQVEF